MRVRRMAAIVLGFAMLHLGAAQADAVCATHATAAADASQLHHAAHRGTPGKAPASHDHGAPVQHDCCPAAGACAGAFEADGETAGGVPAASAAIPATPVTGPAWTALAPEPPPPRA